MCINQFLGKEDELRKSGADNGYSKVWLCRLFFIAQKYFAGSGIREVFSFFTTSKHPFTWLIFAPINPQLVEKIFGEKRISIFSPLALCQSAFKIDPPTASNFDPLFVKKIFILISVFQAIAFIACFDDLAVMC